MKKPTQKLSLKIVKNEYWRKKNDVAGFENSKDSKKIVLGWKIDRVTFKNYEKRGRRVKNRSSSL